MRKTKQRSWISNSGFKSLDYQKTIFAGLGSLDLLTKKFRRSWIAESGLWSLTEKSLRCHRRETSQFTYSKSTIETKEKGVKYIQSQ